VYGSEYGGLRQPLEVFLRSPGLHQCLEEAASTSRPPTGALVDELLVHTDLGATDAAARRRRAEHILAYLVASFRGALAELPVRYAKAHVGRSVVLPQARVSRIEEGHVRWPSLSQDYAAFYGSAGCVFTGDDDVAIYHAYTPSIGPTVEDSVPLKREWCDRMREQNDVLPEMEPLCEYVGRRAVDLFSRGSASRAFASMWIAASLPADDRHREEAKLICARKALYYLRRSIWRQRDTVYRIARGFLSWIVRPAIERAHGIDTLTPTDLLVELASWLNEQGRPEQAVEFLELAHAAMSRCVPAGSGRLASLDRQISFCYGATGRTTAARQLIWSALSRSGTQQNVAGVYPPTVLALAMEGRLAPASEFARHGVGLMGAYTAGFKDSPAVAGIQPPSYVGALAYSYIPDLLAGTSRSRALVVQAIERARAIELVHGLKPLVIWCPSLWQRVLAALRRSRLWRELGHVTRWAMPQCPAVLADEVEVLCRLLARAMSGGVGRKGILLQRERGWEHAPFASDMVDLMGDVGI
jgi:hypothetical protein